MAERKSKPRKKKDEDDEPTGFAKITKSPWYILVMYLSLIPLVAGVLFGLSGFLAAGSPNPIWLIVAAVSGVLFALMAFLASRFK